MAVLLVTYDLRQADYPGYPDFHGTIKSYDWTELSKCSYAIVTDESPGTVYGKLRRFQHEKDHIYIVALAAPWTGYGTKSTNEWLRERL